MEGTSVARFLQLHRRVLCVVTLCVGALIAAGCGRSGPTAADENPDPGLNAEAGAQIEPSPDAPGE